MLGPFVLLTAATTLVFADRATPDPTKTQNAFPLKTAPTIDGVINVDEWAGAGGTTGDSWAVTIVTDDQGNPAIRGGALGDNQTAGVPADNNDLSFVTYAGYDAENLYIAVKVKDSVISTDSAEADSANGSTWMDDSVEVFLDGDNSNYAVRDTSGTNPEVVKTGGQFVITANNAYRDAEAGSPGYGPDKAWYAKTTPLDDGTGYVAEFRIALKTIGNPKVGDVIGFTVGVNDDDDGAAGERQVMWVGIPHTEVTYGNLYLLGRSYTAPKMATAPTVDGIILPGEYAGAEKIAIDAHSAVFDVLAGGDTWPVGDCQYEAWAVHTADAVYVAVDVVDDVITTDTAEAGSQDGSTWEDDSVEVFFDADNDKEPGRGSQNYEGQYVMTANGAWRTAEAHNAVLGSEWNAVATRTYRGYQVEFKVLKSALLNPADGATLGFNIGLNDDDGAGRKAQINWNGRPHFEFTYGSLVLGGGGGGTVSIKSVAVSGSNLELTVLTSNPSGTHGVQEASMIVGPQWSPVANATFSAGAAGTVVARFPKPASSPKFYRVTLQ